MKDYRFIFEKYVLRKHRDSWFKTEKKAIQTAQQIHGNLFIDVGSNRKYYATALKDNFKRIVTIDANPKWQADMQIALSWFNGEAMFYVGDNEGSADSLLQNPHILGKDWTNSGRFNVPVRTFDSLELDADLVKIDVEGAELDILDGMVKYLPRNVIVELHDEKRRYDLRSRMLNKGYNVKRLDKTHWWFHL